MRLSNYLDQGSFINVSYTCPLLAQKIVNWAQILSFGTKKSVFETQI